MLNYVIRATWKTVLGTEPHLILIFPTLIYGGTKTLRLFSNPTVALLFRLFPSSLLVQKGKRRICQARFTAKQIKIHKAMCHSPSTRLFFNHGFSVIFKLKVIRSYKTIGIFGNGVLEPFYDWNKKVLRQGKIEHRDYSRKKIQKQANAVCIFS